MISPVIRMACLISVTIIKIIPHRRAQRASSPSFYKVKLTIKPSAELTIYNYPRESAGDCVGRSGSGAGQQMRGALKLAEAKNVSGLELGSKTVIT